MKILLIGASGMIGSRILKESLSRGHSDEAKAMRQAYGLLVSEDVDFTFLAPSGMIAPGERTGNFRIGGSTMLVDDRGKSEISAEDYAIALVDEVETPKHFRTVFTVGH